MHHMPHVLQCTPKIYTRNSRHHITHAFPQNVFCFRIIIIIIIIVVVVIVLLLLLYRISFNMPHNQKQHGSDLANKMALQSAAYTSDTKALLHKHTEPSAVAAPR
jgi:uncharacterized membrane protein affecting hemolysin expression